MPPNADSIIRQRVMPKDEAEVADPSLIRTGSSSTGRVDSLKNLKGSEVAIEGVIYDLTGFEHPGGNIVHIFGGNDVTVQYKMMHPFHTARHLDKLKKMGRVSDWKPDYVFDTEFEREMKREVFKIVRRGREFGTPGYFFRISCYMILVAYLQYRWITEVSTLRLAVAFGIAKAFIGLNIMHDANHGAISRKTWVNDILGFAMDYIGGQKWFWILGHTTHHAYTNNHFKDPDGFAAEPVILFNNYEPSSPKRKFFHKFQGWFFLPTLSFLWLKSVFNQHIFTLQHPGAIKAGVNMKNDFIQTRRKFAVATRIIYVYFNIVCPFRNAAQAGQLSLTIVHTLSMGFIASVLMATVIALSHNNELVTRDPLKSFRESGKPVCWFKSQVETSTTYGGFIAGALTGGLNFQIEHHLFPRMSSAHYPFIAPTVRAVCKKHGVRYGYFPWIWQSLFSTLRYIHKVGCAELLKNPLDGDF